MSMFSFQFAVLRYFHDPVTQEFLNIGIVVYSKEKRYLETIINKRYGRVSKTFDGIDRNHYGRMVNSIENSINQFGSRLGKISLFDDYPDSIEILLASIVSTDDSSIRFGGFGGGVINDLDNELNRLYSRLVEKYEGRAVTESRRDDQVWHEYAKLFSDFQIIEYLQPKALGTENYQYQFSHSFKNDVWHPMEPVSFDLADQGYILEKANKWIGRAMLLADSEELGTLYLLLGAPSRPDLTDAYKTAARNLESKIKGLDVQVVLEENSKEFTREFAEFVKSHVTQQDENNR